MGIQNFWKIKVGDVQMKELCTHLTWQDLAGKIIAVDAFNIIYRNFSGIKEHLTHNGQITTHIKVTHAKIKMLKQYGITQVWVFDGPYENRPKKYRRTGGLSLKREHIDEVKQLLTLHGIRWIEVGIEAEFYAAEMSRSGQCFGVLSHDTDVLVRGGILLRETSEGLDYLSSSYICERSGLSQDDLLIIAVIIGCDFIEHKSAGVGPITVISKFRNIQLTNEQERILEFFRTPIDRKGMLQKNVPGAQDLEKLSEWLNSLGFKKI